MLRTTFEWLTTTFEGLRTTFDGLSTTSRRVENHFRSVGNHFWSVEIPANGTAKIYLRSYCTYHITKAEFNWPRSRAGITTWVKVILYERSIDGGSRHDTQISHLTTQYGDTSQNLDLQFKGTVDSEYLLMFRVEGENFPNETFPVVLTGYWT